MRLCPAGAVACVTAFALAGCGEGEDAGRAAAPASLPSSGHAYRALDDGQRRAVAEGCRDRAAAGARGAAARQLRSIDPVAVAARLDDAYLILPDRGRPVADVCREVVPFVTPGLRVSFEDAKAGGDGTFSVQTTSDKRLTIRGRVTPAGEGGGFVVSRRAVAPPRPRKVPIAADGSFALENLKLRKLADNTFVLSIHAPPNAPRNVSFTAICLDCLAGGAPPSVTDDA